MAFEGYQALWMPASAAIVAIGTLFGGLLVIQKGMDKLFNIQLFKSKTASVAYKSQDRLDILEPKARKLEKDQDRHHETLLSVRDDVREIKQFLFNRPKA